MNLFDKKIKQKLSHAEMPVEDGIWEAIESRIVHQKDNSRFWFLFIIPLLFAPAALMLWNSAQPETIQDTGLATLIESNNYPETFAKNYNTESNTLIASEELVSPLNTKSYPQLTQMTGLERNPGFLNALESSNPHFVDFGFKLSGLDSQLSKRNGHTRSGSTKVSVINGEIISGQVQKKHSVTPLPVNQFNLATLNANDRGLPKLFANDPGAECHDFKIYHPGFYAFTQFTIDAPFQSLTAKSSEFVEYVQKER